MVRDHIKNRIQASIDGFRAAIISADVTEVDEPTGKKEVEIAWENDGGFHVEEGEAIGVYREQKTIYHIDWADENRGRTTVPEDELVDLEESEYKDLSE